jgi:hypothetical protein
MWLVSIVTALVGSIASSLALDPSTWIEALSGVIDFSVQTQLCERSICPGSQFTKVGASWANIGYLAHADVLYMLSATQFGAWAPLLYVCAGIGALIGVAMNMPPKGYVWFFLGPSLYLFLIGTTQEVRGVDWVVANRQQPIEEVWRDAEVGLANLEITERDGITITKDGPGRLYPVATPLIFLDSLFSNTANFLVEWSGLYRQRGTGSSNSNLANSGGQIEGPWYLLSNLKWGLLENIVGASTRDPMIRDAWVTFLTSECGDAFKKGVDSGRYIAASQARGIDLPETVMKTYDRASVPLGSSARTLNYRYVQDLLDVASIPTPRSLLRIFQQGDSDGSFGAFAPLYNPDPTSNMNMPLLSGRGQSIVCSEYLYTLIQAFRHEAGHAYWQLVRSAPNGMTREQFLRSLFYGWNIRTTEGGAYANDAELRAFAKHLILLYIVRNELMFSPQVTEVDQRFSPSEQNRINTDAHVRTMGSKSKFAELYNWAILMPFLQGILLYFVIMGYPFAAMMMILPGHHKAFLTWVSFFAWLKLWDVGFAFVQVLERSVWAMIGNQTAAGKIAGMVIDTARTAGSIGVDCSQGVPGGETGLGGGSGLATRLSELCPIPRVCSVAASAGMGGDNCSQAVDQTTQQALLLWDRMLLLGASADLDLANGYYIYIMAALYMAVPGVTGQLVLGAKASVAGMAGNLFNSVASEAAGAARTGYQHEATNKALSNAASQAQAAYGKAMRGSKLPSTIFGNENDNLNRQFQGAALEGQMAALNTGADMTEMRAKSFGSAGDANVAIAKAGGKWLGFKSDTFVPESTGDGAAGGKDAKEKDKKQDVLGKVGALANAVNAMASHDVAQKGLEAKAFVAGRGLDNNWDKKGLDMASAGAQLEGQRANQQAAYEAEMAVWEAKSAFASHASASAGIAGMNTGSLSATQKPTGMGMASAGEFNSFSGEGSSWFGQGASLQGADIQGQYGFGGHFKHTAPQHMQNYKADYGSTFASSSWGGAFSLDRQAVYAAVGQYGNVTKFFPEAAQFLVENKEAEPNFITSEFQVFQNGSGVNQAAPSVKTPEFIK